MLPKPLQDLPSRAETGHLGAILAQLGAIMAHLGRNLASTSPIFPPTSAEISGKSHHKSQEAPQDRPRSCQNTIFLDFRPTKPPFSSFSDPPSHHFHRFSIPPGFILNTDPCYFQVHRPIKHSTQTMLQTTKHTIQTIPRQPQQSQQCPNAGTVAGVAKHLG